jgi:hypothetical protein
MSEIADRVRDGLVAGAVAGVLSGLPSTVHALAMGRSPLDATLAAGAIVAPGRSSGVQLLAAVPVHAALSLGWGVALSFVLPRRRGALTGALAGMGIAALDLGVFGRRFPAVRELPAGPQLADHVAYGIVVGATLERLARARTSTSATTTPSATSPAST